MNKVEKALVHALFIHLHHNIEKAVDFKAFKELNDKVSAMWPGAILVEPGDDAAVFNIPGIEGSFAAKLESHCSPCVPRPYDAAATGAGGAMRDIVAMGGRPFFLLDFIGTRPLEQKVLVGNCGFAGKCECGECREMTSGERLNLMLSGVRDMCRAMDVFVAGGGFSTSFSDIVPAVVVAVIGKLVTDKPLTKPAKRPGDKFLLIGGTGSDGNDTLYRAGLVDIMRPAEALFDEERAVMDATLEVFKHGGINACSDLGAAGVGAAVCESARYGGFGAEVDLGKVPLREEKLSPEEILICETQARMMLQMGAEEAEAAREIVRKRGVSAEIIGEITEGNSEIFRHNGAVVAEIPNAPDASVLEELDGV